MSIFGSILNKIFHHGQAPSNPATASARPAGQQAPAAPSIQQPAPQQPAANPVPATAQPVDVEAVLSELAQSHGGGGNWRTSIVDLLKLLDLDSSLQARKELAQELGIHVAADGSAEENIALHKAVMTKLEKNGGKVPASLKG